MNTLIIYIDNSGDNKYLGDKRVISLGCAFGTPIASSFFTEHVQGKQVPETYTMYEADNETKVPVKNFRFYHTLTSEEMIGFLQTFQGTQKQYPRTPPPKSDKRARDAFFSLKKGDESLIKGLIAFLRHTKRDVIVDAE